MRSGTGKPGTGHLVGVAAYFSAMADLMIEGTVKTPMVRLDAASGLLEISGCSVHENADRFYRPLIDAVERYAAGPRPETTVRITLSYFNSSSAKYILDLLKILDEAHAAGRGRMQVEWHHQEDDLDMQEAGEDYRSLLDMPVRLVAD